MGAQRIGETREEYLARERAYAKARYAGPDRELLLARRKAWVLAHPEKAKEIQRKTDLKRHYGITPEDFDRMLVAQGGVCALCREEPGTHVDHCHKSGAVRAILCAQCNLILGKIEKSADPASLAGRIAEYVSGAWLEASFGEEAA